MSGALGVEASIGALGAEIAAVMRPLLRPLIEQWESLTGDHEAVHATAARWREMARGIDTVADTQRAAATAVAPEWEGRAHEAFAVATDDAVRDMRRLAERTADVGDLLDEAAAAVHEAELLVASLIRELIEWAALSLAVSAATGLVTFAPRPPPGVPPRRRRRPS